MSPHNGDLPRNPWAILPTAHRKASGTRAEMQIHRRSDEIAQRVSVKRVSDPRADSLFELRAGDVAAFAAYRVPELSNVEGVLGDSPYACRSASAACSPMTAHGAWVLPVVTRGMIEASATRNALTP